MQFGLEIPNALPKNLDNIGKYDYEEQDYRQKTEQSSEMKLEKVWEKSLASPAVVKSNRECSKV